ncbi:unnamed protein product [Adineta ricciae]|uniref:Uncharacterized protein n=1 Tax=Adineta ricciae TaxID=249248 RepID=A0A815DUP5_ADIRI|nr:unnamed protein product [Adineta ricciae]
MLINCLSFFALIYSSTSQQFHLYRDHQNRSCLYSYFSQQEDSYSIVPYCFQSETMNTNLKCHNHGNLTSFTELQSQNISTHELYYWQVPIDIIDLYGKFNQHSDVDRTFCICSDLRWFGPYCEYTFQSFETNFNDIIDEQFLCRETYLITQRFTFTTYQGIDCQPFGLGLDWRHICNGLIDCENGEDELYCHILEPNECDPK